MTESGGSFSTLLRASWPSQWPGLGTNNPGNIAPGHTTMVVTGGAAAVGLATMIGMDGPQRFLEMVNFYGDEGYGGGGFPPAPPAPPPPQLCGVNPVTGAPGLNPKSSGLPGQLRPGLGGRGWFGAPRDGGRRSHDGVDVAGSIGSSVYSAHGGTVTFAGFQRGYGNIVVVDIGNGYTMRYSHLAAVDVEVGEELETGEALGTLGQTGNAMGQPASEAHVHFEVRNGGKAVNPRNFLNSVCPW